MRTIEACHRLLLLASAWIPLAIADPAAVPAPPELRAWDAWVLEGHEARRCPWLAPGDPMNEQRRICAWPGPLDLSVEALGARFQQRWQVDAESWVQLPGNAEHWPEHLTADGAPVAVVEHDGMPALRLGPGVHALTGDFRWARRPEVLPVPAGIGIVALSVNGSRLATATRTEEGIVLGRRAASRQEDQLELRVYRRLTDQQPARLTTRLELSVAGDPREIRLPDLLPAGFVALALEAGVTARLDPDNALRLQLRPGRFTVSVEARGPSPVAAVTLAAHPAPWPAQEVWSVEGIDRLRVAAIEGAASVDPAVANAPADWRELPAFTLASGQTLKVVERTRGIAPDDRSELGLERRIWLDFSGEGYTALDTINGTMRRGWRLDLAAPYRLASARTGEAPLLVTRGTTSDAAGIEWRAPAVAVTAISRVARDGRTLPATGWQERFAHASGELVLPPAYRLLAAFGPDSTPDAWLERWHLLDLFVVLLAAVTAWRLLGWPATVLTLAALGLTHQDVAAPSWLWINALLALALLRAAPEGRLRRAASVYHGAALVIVALALVPFVVDQVRLAVFPQLEAAGEDGLLFGRPAKEAPRVLMEAEPPAEVPPPPAAREDAAAAPATLAVDAASGGRLSAQSRYANERKLEQLVVTAERRVASYEPGTLTQSGPGVPGWRYHVYRYGWNGPVEASEQLRFVICPPWLTRLWRILGAALSVLLLVTLASPARALLDRLRPPPAAAAAGLVGVALLIVAPFDSRAASTPDPALLGEYAKRLLAPPACAPTCVAIAAASVEVGAARLRVELTASALDRVAILLPSGEPNWVPDRVTVDGVAAGGIYRDPAGARYVPLGRGRHIVAIEGPIADVDALAINFPLRPHVIDVAAGGWEVAGVAERRLLSGALELARRRSAPSLPGARASQAEFPPFVSVEREFSLGHDWTVATRIRRVAPVAGAFTVQVPLLPAEEPVTPDLVMNKRVVSVGFDGANSVRAYSSTLPQAETIELIAAANPSYTEIWRFDVAPSWHVEFDGIPAVTPQDAGSGTWRFEYAPRAGERLLARITRPAAVPGPTLAFDRVSLDEVAGARSRDTELHLEYRSTQGGRQPIGLPRDARVTAITADGEPVAVRPEGGTLSLPVLPGRHRVDIRWQVSAAPSTVMRSSAVAVNAPASNLGTTLRVPDDRWVLYAFGPGVGPAVLYWGELLLFVALAIAIGRTGWTPLSSRDWLLLGLGLSTFSWVALGVFAAFVTVFEWRGHAAAPAAWSPRRFNALQLALALLALVAFAALVAAVPEGLLSRPDMRIAGGYSPGGGFRWFNDQTSATLPVAGLVTVSLWWYKLAMLAWALWLSFALTRWVRWAWSIFRRDGLWRSGASSPPAAAASPPHPWDAGRNPATGEPIRDNEPPND